MLGKTFSRITVKMLNISETFKRGIDTYNCICKCSNKIIVDSHDLNGDRIQGCDRNCEYALAKFRGLTLKEFRVRKRFGFLTIIGKYFIKNDYNKKPRSHVKVKCDCGVIIVKQMQDLWSGNTTSCSRSCDAKTAKNLGVTLKEFRAAFQIRKVFNDLTIIFKTFLKNGQSWIRCKCICGKITKVMQHNL